MSKADKVRALFRTAANFGATENERQVAERFAWDLLRKDETLIEEIAQAVLLEAQEQGREPEWPSPVFFDVWSRTQQAKTAQASEARRQARDQRTNAAAAAAAAAAAQAAQARAAGAPTSAPPPYVPPIYPPPPPATPPTNDRWEKLKNVAAEWLGDALNEVADGLSIIEQINEEVSVNISNTHKTVTVKITFPVYLAQEIYDEQGTLAEFSRLVGVKVGEDLAQAFKDSGY